MQPVVQHNPLLYSTLAEDPDLSVIVETFVDELPARAASILDCLECEDWEGLRRASRYIRGAAGSYGFAAIRPYAGEVESAVTDTRPEEEIRAAVEQLLAICGSVRPGVPAW